MSLQNLSLFLLVVSVFCHQNLASSEIKTCDLVSVESPSICLVKSHNPLISKDVMSHPDGRPTVPLETCRTRGSQDLSPPGIQSMPLGFIVFFSFTGGN